MCAMCGSRHYEHTRKHTTGNTLSSGGDLLFCSFKSVPDFKCDENFFCKMILKIADLVMFIWSIEMRD
jgi:hypothetical protein